MEVVGLSGLLPYWPLSFITLLPYCHVPLPPLPKVDTTKVLCIILPCLPNYHPSEGFILSLLRIIHFENYV